MSFSITLLRLMIFSLALTSCAKNNSSDSQVKIQFDTTLFNQSSSDVASKTNVHASSDDGPNWGLADPTDLSQIDCWGVFVGGPESELQGSSCSNAAGKTIASFGVRAGFYPINDAGEVFVPAGENRQFYLAGMASSNGSCELGFDTNPDINFSNYSAPFILGQANVNLNRAQEVVPIALSNQFDSSNKVQSCDFIQDNGDGTTVAPNSLSLSHYETKRNIWVNDVSHVSPRTVTFTHSGVSSECSRDGGSSFSSCDTASSFIWNIGDENINHVIRVHHANGSSEEVTFKPLDWYPNLQFVSCTHTFSSSFLVNDSSFTSALGTANNVVCLDDATTINDNAGSGLILNTSNITLISKIGHSAQIINATGRSLQINGSTSNVKVVGIELRTNGSSTNNVQVDGSTQDIHFQDVHFISTASTAGYWNINVNGAGTNSNPIQFRNCFIDSQNFEDGLRANNSVVKAEKIHIKSNRIGIDIISNADVEVLDSLIQTTGSSASDNKSIQVNGPSSLFLDQSVIIDNSGAGLVLAAGGMSGDNATADINRSVFIRRNANATSTAAIVSPAAAGDRLLNSTHNQNLFCSEAVAVSFSDMTDNNHNGSSNWSNANQVSSSLCPQEFLDLLTGL